jgi:peptide/nickel transport system permease protein
MSTSATSQPLEPVGPVDDDQELGVRTRTHGVWGRYAQALRSPRGAAGLTVVLLVVLLAVFVPLFLPYGEYEQGIDALSGPSGKHLLGTDEVGRDLLARLLAGTRVDLVITLIAVPISAAAGTLFGLLGMLSRFVGGAFQRVFDVLLGVPAVILGVAVAIAIAPGMKSVIVAIVLVTLPMFGRQAGSALASQLPLDYVAAAEVLGFPRRRVMLRHVLPNIIDAIFVRIAFTMAQAITIEGGLSVIGLGIQSPQSSLGSMIKGGSAYLLTTPLYALAPVGVVIILVVGYTMVSDALNQAVLRK